MVKFSNKTGGSHAKNTGNIYKQLTLEERYQIKILLEIKMNQTEIARGCSTFCVSPPFSAIIAEKGGLTNETARHHI